MNLKDMHNSSDYLDGRIKYYQSIIRDLQEQKRLLDDMIFDEEKHITVETFGGHDG